MTFESDLLDAGVGLVAEEPHGAPSTLVAFGGIKGGLGIPPFEFFRVTQGLEARRIFARDLRQTWYLSGIEGLGSRVDETAHALGAVVGDGSARVVTSGNSAGGFGAILYGTLIGADVIHAFSPQTVLTRSTRAAWLDLRWLRQMHTVRGLDGVPTEQLDLRAFLVGRDRVPQIHLHYCDAHRLDRLHAERLREVPNVHLHPHPEGGHRLVTVLRDAGTLRSILEEALAPPA